MWHSIARGLVAVCIAAALLVGVIGMVEWVIRRGETAPPGPSNLTAQCLSCAASLLAYNADGHTRAIVSFADVQAVAATATRITPNCGIEQLNTIAGGRDYWGTPFILVLKSETQQFSTLRSAGPDGQFTFRNDGSYCDSMVSRAACGDDIVIPVMLPPGGEDLR